MTINPDESVAMSHMTLEHLLAETGQYLSPREMETIQRAYEVANEAHRGVVRISGDPYIQHPLEVALLLADLAAVEADADVNLPAGVGVVVLVHGLLNRHRAGDRFAGGTKGHHEAIAEGFDFAAAVGLDLPPHQLLLDPQDRGRGFIAALVAHLRRALHVGEQDGYGPFENFFAGGGHPYP